MIVKKLAISVEGRPDMELDLTCKYGINLDFVTNYTTLQVALAVTIMLTDNFQHFMEKKIGRWSE